MLWQGCDRASCCARATRPAPCGHADQSPGAGWISLEAFQELLRPARLTADQYAKECVRKVDVEPERGGGGDAALQHTLSVDNVLVQ